MEPLIRDFAPQTPASVKALLTSPMRTGQDPVREIEERNFLCTLYNDSFREEVYISLGMVLEASRRHGFRAGELLAHVSLANRYFEVNQPDKAREHVEQALSITEEPGLDYKYRVQGVHMLAWLYWARGEYTVAYDMNVELLKNIESIEDVAAAGWLYYAVGVFNYDLRDYEQSIAYCTRAREYFEKSQNDIQRAYGCARSNTGIASGYIQLQRYEDAERLLEESLAVYRYLMVTTGISRVLNDLAVIEKIRGNHTRAVGFQLEAFQIRQETGHEQGKLTSLNELGELYLETGDIPAAEKYLLQAKELGEMLVAKAKTFRAYFLLSQLYKKTGDAARALDYYEKFHQVKEEVLGQNATNEIKRLQNRFEKEKSEKEAEIERLRNVELKQAHEAISIKNKEILDSIHYARRIQQSLLPTEVFIQRLLKQLKG